jgi:putative serine protease PepD
MTNHPRYSPPPPPPGRRPGDDRTAVYPSQQGQSGYQQPYDWRYATQQQQHAQQRAQQQQQAYRQQPYDPYRGVPQQPLQQRPPQPARPHKRSRAGAMTVGALTIAVISAGIGGGVALMAKPDNVSSGTQITAAPSVPAASLPAGSVEQVAA